MNLFNLDGFLTCLLIGPETILPSQWLPIIWQESESDEMKWESIEEADKFMGLIMTFYNSIASVFQEKANSYCSQTLGNSSEVDDIEDWCLGFLAGLDLSNDSWKPLMESKEDQILIAPIFLFTTKEGLDYISQKPEYRKYTPEDWTEMIRFMVVTVYKYWLPYRKLVHGATHQAVSQKISRNALCPCGSGKKYKNCCLS